MPSRKKVSRRPAAPTNGNVVRSAMDSTIVKAFSPIMQTAILAAMGWGLLLLIQLSPLPDEIKKHGDWLQKLSQSLNDQSRTLTSVQTTMDAHTKQLQDTQAFIGSAINTTATAGVRLDNVDKRFDEVIANQKSTADQVRSIELTLAAGHKQ